jgi:glucose-6-phosphate 1-dehydrogenase
MCLRAKIPGEQMEGEDVELIAAHQPAGEMSPYERLLGDALHGDQTLFASEDGIEAQWRIVQPILDDVTPVHEYDQNTWGPAEAGKLMEGETGWLNPKELAVR